MMRQRWLVALAIAVLGIAAGAARGTAAEPGFKRGATLVELFQFPATTGEGLAKSYADPAYPRMSSALALFDFDELHRIGFDHMRVPLDMGPLMQGTEPQRQKIIADLVAAVAAINRHGLAVLVPLFPPSLQHELPQTYLDGLDGPRFTAYAAVVDRVSTALSSIDPGAVALEPMNEPQSQCRVYFATDWIAYQQAMGARIRRISARLPLFLTGGCWSNIEGIVTLDTDLLPIAGASSPRNCRRARLLNVHAARHVQTFWYG
jgi:endoglucanase